MTSSLRRRRLNDLLCNISSPSVHKHVFAFVFIVSSSRITIFPSFHPISSPFIIQFPAVTPWWTFNLLLKENLFIFWMNFALTKKRLAALIWKQAFFVCLFLFCRFCSTFSFQHNIFMRCAKRLANADIRRTWQYYKPLFHLPFNTFFFFTKKETHFQVYSFTAITAATQL